MLREPTTMRHGMLRDVTGTHYNEARDVSIETKDVIQGYVKSLMKVTNKNFIFPMRTL